MELFIFTIAQRTNGCYNIEFDKVKIFGRRNSGRLCSTSRHTIHLLIMVVAIAQRRQVLQVTPHTKVLMLVLTVIFVVVLVSVVLAMEKVGMNLPLELVQLRALIVTVATNLANVASAKVLEKPKNFTQKRYITNPLCCTPGLELRSAEREQTKVV